MTAAFTPLKALQAWYDDTTGYVAPKLFLLDATVTEMIDTYTTVTDLPGLLPTTGNYNGSLGITGGNWPLYYDTDTGVMELSLPAASWTSPATYSLTYRWLAIALTGGYLLNVVDFGTAQTLASQALQLNAAESEYIPNSYPVFRWAKA